jgi:hypothetical protein
LKCVRIDKCLLNLLPASLKEGMIAVEDERFAALMFETFQVEAMKTFDD